MNRGLTKKIGIISIGFVLCGGIAFLASEYSGKSLRSESINDVVVPGACYLQAEIDARIAEKIALE
jgi:hypothetical protein